MTPICLGPIFLKTIGSLFILQPNKLICPYAETSEHLKKLKQQKSPKIC